MSAPADGMSHTDIEELLGVYALDALDPETAAVVESHLDECLRCAVEVAQHHEVAGLLANSGGAPPAELWDGISARLDGTSDLTWDRLAARLDAPGGDREVPDAAPTGASGDAAVVPITAGSRRRRRASAGAALVAAAAAVLALVLGLQVHHLNGQVSALRSGPQLSTAERAALQSPSTRRIPLTAPSMAGTGSTPVTIVLTAAGTGFVIDDRSDGLAPLPSDRTYQLWGVVGHRAISLGLLGPHPKIVPFSVAGSAPVSEFAITDEVAGGVVTSVHTPVAVGSVPV